MVPITKINHNVCLLICLCLCMSMYEQTQQIKQSTAIKSSAVKQTQTGTSAAKPVPTTATPADPAYTATQAPGRQAARQGRQHPFQEGHNRRQDAYVPVDRHHQQVARYKGRHPQVVRRRELPFHRQNDSED